MIQRTSKRAWLLGLVHAIAAGAANAAAGALADPAHFNLTGPGCAALGKMALAGAVIGVAMYLKQSPVAIRWDGQERRSGQSVSSPASSGK